VCISFRCVWGFIVRCIILCTLPVCHGGTAVVVLVLIVGRCVVWLVGAVHHCLHNVWLAMVAALLLSSRSSSSRRAAGAWTWGAPLWVCPAACDCVTVVRFRLVPARPLTHTTRLGRCSTYRVCQVCQGEWLIAGPHRQLCTYIFKNRDEPPMSPRTQGVG
jgi:hypothetical protein